ncbi:hypothetical protein [Sessilibacter sp. MAH4]
MAITQYSQTIANLKRIFIVLTMVTAAFAITGCANKVVKSTAQTPLEVETSNIPENELLDVGIVIFDPGLEDESKSVIPVSSEVRKAESQFFPVKLMDAMQRSAAWGAVRVVPNENAAVDVMVTGKIISSDGERLILNIRAFDSVGDQWFEKEYEQKASKYSYDPAARIRRDPFSSVYNEIANDLLEYKRQLASDYLRKLRIVTELKFAKDFSPEAFDNHLYVDKKGEYQLNRLPAESDPMLERIRTIRERDYLFVDTLQEYYGTFVNEMEKPYQEWRSQSYSEAAEVRRLRAQAIGQTVAGVASVVGGILAAGSSDASARAAGSVAIVGGGYLIKEGFGTRSDSKLHLEALRELGDSLGAEVESHYIDLEDRTITLSGTVENQYEQWREILRDIYDLETGGVQ